MKSYFEKAIELIDEKNSKDPNLVIYRDKEYPKELLYSERMTAQLKTFEKNASEELKIAVRAQHICRWEIQRHDYEMNRVGYFQWRNDVKKMHGKITRGLLEKVGYNDEFIDRVIFLITKKQIKKDKETQILEDVVCLVFIQYYLEEFIAKHSEEKIIDILQKTWSKMSRKGQESALKLNLPERSLGLVKKAV